MFSIVIPYYKKRQYIERCIDSILCQSYQKFEILLVDDGSEDDIAELCNNNKYVNKVTLITQVNKGVSVARNKGIESANYDWVAFLDADDWWEITFLEEIKRAISIYPNHLIFGVRQAIYAKSNYIDTRSILLPSSGEIGVVNYYEAFALGVSLINSSNAVVSKAHFYREGFFMESQKNYEDINLWLRLCHTEKIVIVNKRLSIYVSYQSYTAAKAGLSAKDFIIMLDTFSSLKQKIHGENRNYLKIIYEKHCEYVVLRFFNRYSKVDQKNAFDKMSKLLESSKLYKLRFIYLFRLSKTINLLKKFKQRLKRI